MSIVSIVVLVSGCAVSPNPISTKTLAQRANADRARLKSDQPALIGTLSPREAVARAILFNRKRHVKSMQAALANQQLDAANYDMLPSLTAQAGYTTRSEYAATESVPFIDGEPRRGLGSDSYSIGQEKNRTTYGVDFTWSILDFGLSYVRAKQQADKYLISREEERKAVQNLAQQTRTAYWKAVSANRLLHKIGPLTDKVDGALVDSRAITQKRLSNPLTHYSYERSLLDVKRSLQSLRDELVGAKAKLARLMGLPPDTAIALPAYDSDALKTPKAVFDISTMERTALLERPEIRKANYKQRIARNDVRASLLQMFPDLSLSAGYQHDSNDFLRYNNWASAGASLSYDLLNLFKTHAKHEAAKTEVKIAKQRRLAASLAVLTQVHLAVLQYDASKQQLKTARHYLRVSRSISLIQNHQAATGSTGDLPAIKERLNSLVAELRRDLSYAHTQNAFARIYQSMGLDPYPMTPGETPEQLARSIAARRRSWEAGYIGVVVDPVKKQHPVLKVRQPGESPSFTVAADTFSVAGNTHYTAKTRRGKELPDWLDFDGATRTFTVAADAPAKAVPVTLTVKNDKDVSARDTFILKPGYERS